MKCPKCQSENPDTVKFCGECGTNITSAEEAQPPVTKTLEAPVENLSRGTLFADRYEIIEELGKGGMGAVYRVEDTKAKEEIALKLIKPEIATDKKTIDRFRNELTTARKIRHKNICGMYDLGEANGIHYITMEYVPGEDLKSFLRRSRQISINTAIEIVKQVCEGVTEAHRLGVVHRDLKPSNIMVDKEGNARVMDFGIARSLMAKGVTQTGMIIGTPDYMSPEQAEGKDVDLRSDIYSLGIILYEMVTGRVPFEGDSSLSVVLKHKTERPLDPRELNDQVTGGLSAAILKCMEKERERRYQSAEELLSELENIKKGFYSDTALPQSRIPAFLAEAEGEAIEEEKPVFVAREQELVVLGKYLDTALSSKGQVVFVEGEAGSGKSALIKELTRRAQDAHADLIVAGGKCNAQTGIGDPYLPFIEIFSLLTGDVEAKWAAGLIAREHALKLWKLIPLSAKAVLDKGPDLIDVFVPGSELLSRCEASTSSGAGWLFPLKNLVERKASLPPDSMLQQSNLFEQFTRVLETLARQRPLLLVLDDLQWADAGSVSLLFHLGRRIKESPVIILGAFRPAEVSLGRAGERHPLEVVLHEFKRDFGDIELEVDKAEGQQFVDAFLDTEPNRLDNTFRETFFRQTRGNPLFTVELLRDMQDRGVLVKDEKGRWVEGPELNWDALPARVDAVIEERISRLTGKLREVLTFASVEGEEFTAEVVARLQETEVRKLVSLISSELDKRHHLVRAKGIHRLEKQRLSMYLFQHILFQRYLYNSLDDIERTHLHEEVGHILEALYGDQADEIAVQLAHHFQEAGIAPKSVEYLQKAGAKAVRLSANEEAIAYFNKGLDLLQNLPDTPERTQQELLLQMSLIAPIVATRGWGAPEEECAVKRAHEICNQIGETPQLFTVLSHLVHFYAMKADYHKAIELGKQTNRIADQVDDPVCRAISYTLLGWPLFNVGEFDKAREYVEYTIANYDYEKFKSQIFSYGLDLGVVAYGWDSWILMLQGHLDQAAKRNKEMLSLAREIEHPHTLAYALTVASEFNLFIRDYQTAEEFAEPLIRISTEGGFVYWLAHGIFYQGESRTLEGQVEEGIKQMHQGINMARATGTETCLTRLNARMGENCQKVGQIEEGLKAVARGIDMMRKYDEIYYEPELHRIEGELLQMKGEVGPKVEACFRKAVEVSQRMELKSLELRAVMSLSRLWQKQGKKEEARKMLEEIYGWFTEGFNTGDLKEANALLEELP